MYPIDRSRCRAFEAAIESLQCPALVFHTGKHLRHAELPLASMAQSASGILASCEYQFLSRMAAWVFVLTSQPGKKRGIPPSAYCFDQQHICFQSASHQVDIISLIRKSSGLRSDDLQISVDATGIPVLEETKRVFRGGRRFVLLYRFGVQYSKNDEIVFYLLK